MIDIDSKTLTTYIFVKFTAKSFRVNISVILGRVPNLLSEQFFDMSRSEVGHKE